MSRITGIVDGFLFAKVVSELEERTSAFGLIVYVTNQPSGCSRLETLVVRYGVYGLLPLRGGR